MSRLPFRTIGLIMMLAIWWGLATRAQAQETLQTKLGKRIKDFPGFEANTPLKDALGFLQETYKLKITVDSKSFQQLLMIMEPENQPVRMPKLTDCRTATILHLVARQAQGVCLVGKDQVIILPNDPELLAANQKKGLKPLPAPPTKEVAFYANKLEKAVSMNGFEANTPLKEALGFLAEKYNLNIMIDVESFGSLGIMEVENGPIQLQKINNMRLGAVIQMLCKQVKGSYQFTDNIVLIVPAKP